MTRSLLIRTMVFALAIGSVCFQASGRAQSSGTGKQSSKLARQQVPDWLAWRVFHESLAFHNQQQPMKVETPQKKGLYPRPVSTFQQEMKRRFGLSAEQTT